MRNVKCNYLFKSNLGLGLSEDYLVSATHLEILL